MAKVIHAIPMGEVQVTFAQRGLDGVWRDVPDDPPLHPCACGALASIAPGLRHSTPVGACRWSVHCSQLCGAEVIGDTEGEVRRKWAEGEAK